MQIAEIHVSEQVAAIRIKPAELFTIRKALTQSKFYETSPSAKEILNEVQIMESILNTGQAKLGIEGCMEIEQE